MRSDKTLAETAPEVHPTSHRGTVSRSARFGRSGWRRCRACRRLRRCTRRTGGRPAGATWS